MANYADLNKCDLFLNMTQSEIENVLEQFEINETPFKKDTILAMQDEPCNRLIILTSGSIKAEMSDPSGRVVKIEDIYAPSPLAILFLFGIDNRFPVQVTALEDLTALVVPKHTVLKILQSNEQILTNYLNISAIYASRLREKLHLMSFRTIRQKIAIYLLKLSAENNNANTLTLDKTQKVLAEYFGVSRPSLTRELIAMQKDNIIVLDKKDITILNKNTLIQLTRFQ